MLPGLATSGVSFRQRLWRRAVWFFLYLATLAAHDQIAFGGDHPKSVEILLF
jgi:hypothetical protein